MKEANLHAVDNESFTWSRVLDSYQALRGRCTPVYSSSAGKRPRWTGSDEDILKTRKLAYVSEVMYVYLVLVLSQERMSLRRFPRLEIWWVDSLYSVMLVL